ncbi:NAD(P)-binding domain-containing protein [Spirosoma panaciterrae]|uniref:NAD(P)-binding domain-containing protein n=1 Tax=Spirosoma panaciterrae TaxID=496058 RepID=UPI00037BB69B|nr:NAD(P)-binding domain-containing protein [Spirosoma panaciterrae]
MKPTIAIIGLGNAGSLLATRLAGHSYRLLLFDQDRSKAQALRETLLQTVHSVDAEAMDCKVTACWEADLLVLAVSEARKKVVAEQIRQVATCKIVISLATLSRADQSGAHLSGAVQQWLPDSKLVNVWLAPAEDAHLPDSAFLSGTHEGALAVVSELLTVAALTPIEVEDWSA